MAYNNKGNQPPAIKKMILNNTNYLEKTNIKITTFDSSVYINISSSENWKDRASVRLYPAQFFALTQAMKEFYGAKVQGLLDDKAHFAWDLPGKDVSGKVGVIWAGNKFVMQIFDAQSGQTKRHSFHDNIKGYEVAGANSPFFKVFDPCDGPFIQAMAFMHAATTPFYQMSDQRQKEYQASQRQNQLPDNSGGAQEPF